MRPRFQRIGLVAQLLLAILSDLRRRAWWAYRAGSSRARPEPSAIVARRAAEPEIRPPLVTAAWRPLADRALPVQRRGRAVLPAGAHLAVVWIDVHDRPEIGDLPRVLDSGSWASGVAPVAATQWLFDPPTQAVVLIATLVDPVTATCPIHFELPGDRELLELIASTGQLCVALGSPPAFPQHGTLRFVDLGDLRPGFVLPISSIFQLRQILLTSAHTADTE